MGIYRVQTHIKSRSEEKNICSTAQEVLLPYLFANFIETSVREREECLSSTLAICSHKSIAEISLIDQSNTGILPSRHYQKKFDIFIDKNNGPTWAKSC